MKHPCQAVVYMSIVSSGLEGLGGACSYILPSLYQIFPRYHKLTLSWTSRRSIRINPSAGLTVLSSPAVTSSPASQISLIIKGETLPQHVLWLIPLCFTPWANHQLNSIPDSDGLKTRPWASGVVWKWIFGVIPRLVLWSRQSSPQCSSLATELVKVKVCCSSK